jgi:hypothetical protein
MFFVLGGAKVRYFLVFFAATLAAAQQSFTPIVVAAEGTPSQVLYGIAGSATRF